MPGNIAIHSVEVDNFKYVWYKCDLYYVLCEKAESAKSSKAKIEPQETHATADSSEADNVESEGQTETVTIAETSDTKPVVF